MQNANIFSKLISPVKVDDFFQNYFEKKHLHIHREIDGNYHHILNTVALDRYFQARNLTHDFLRVVKNGNDCHIDTWTKFEHRNNTNPYRIVVMENLFSLFNEGATIVINAAQTAIPSLTEFCSSLEYELKTCVQPNVYITPPNSQGFMPHFDPHDVFILQILGNKKWYLYDSPEKLPVKYQPVADYEKKEPNHIIEMCAGDLLYMPRGTIHFAKSSGEPSIHITVGLIARYWFHLLRDLFELAQEDETFRKMLPFLQTEQDTTHFIEIFTQNIKTLMEKTDIQTLLDKNHINFVERHLIDKRGHFTDLLRIEQINLDTVVSRRKYIDYLLEKREKDVCIKFSKEEISFPHFVYDSLEIVLQNKPFAVKEIKGLISDAGKLELVKKFVQTGFLEIQSI